MIGPPFLCYAKDTVGFKTHCSGLQDTFSIYSGPSLQRRHLFLNILTLNRVCCYKEYIFRTKMPFCADQNDVIKNFAVVMSAIIKRADLFF